MKDTKIIGAKMNKTNETKDIKKNIVNSSIELKDEELLAATGGKLKTVKKKLD